MDILDYVATAAAKAVSVAGKVGNSLGEIVANEEVQERIGRIPADLGPYGVDAFGFDPEYVKKVSGVFGWAYRHYFRCQTEGANLIPDGRCLIVSNHSGQLPFDAAMITIACMLDREPPRYPRSMIERFVPATAFVGTFLARVGQILGTPENCRRLLDKEAAILVFPEGVRGLNKPWSKRYQLQGFGQGFMRLAIEKGAPIVPCAVVGAEEQAPTLFDAKALGKVFGMPSLPVTLSPAFGALPLPSRYHITFGDPMTFDGDANDEDEVILDKVEQVRRTMQRMVERGLAEREHVYW